MVFGGRNPSGLCRLVDPISHAVQEAPLEDLARDDRRAGASRRSPDRRRRRRSAPVRHALVPAHDLALSPSARPCAGGLAVRADFRPHDAPVLPGGGRQGADPSRLRDLVRARRRPCRHRLVRRRRCNTCAPMRCPTPPTGSTSSSANACSRIFCACRSPISRPARPGKRSPGCGNWRRSAASSPDRLCSRRSTSCSPSCSSACCSPIRGR